MTLTPLQETVGQMLVVGFRGCGVSHEVGRMLREIQPGGVVLFDYDLPSKGEAERNVESPEQVRNLTAQLQKRSAIPLLIAVDAEGGHVAAHALAFMAGLKRHDIIPALKHFPGHGGASGDTHLGVTDVTETYQKDKELEPYRILIGRGYTGPIMTAHIVNRNLGEDGLPGTLSPAVITGVLRNSDDMQMGAIVEEHGLEEAAVRTVQAGVDMVLLANQIGDYDLEHVYRVRDAVVSAVENSSIPEQRVYESAERIMTLKRRFRIAP